MKLLASLVLATLLTLSHVRSQKTNLTLFEIEPCAKATVQTVSRFKSDIYAVKPNFNNCLNASWWPEAASYNRTGLRVISRISNISITEEKAVVFVSRQEKSDVTSWSIPFQPQGFHVDFHEVNRTMCPSSFTGQEFDEPDNQGHLLDETDYLFYVDVFSSSTHPVEYRIMVDVVPKFVIDLEEAMSFVVGAASPQIYYFKFPEGSETVTVEASANSDMCIFFSVQKNDCPINDLLETAKSRGIYQTMSKSAFLTVSADQVTKREFMVVVISTNYSVCHGSHFEKMWEVAPPNSSVLDRETKYEQNVTVVIRNLEPISKFVLAIFFPFLIFLIFIGMVGVYACFLPRIFFTIEWGENCRHPNFSISYNCPLQSGVKCCRLGDGGRDGMRSEGGEDGMGLLGGRKGARSYKSIKEDNPPVMKSSPGTSLLSV